MNGDLVTVNGHAGSRNEARKVFSYYVLESESEQRAFLQLHEVVRVSVDRTIEEIEHARNKGNFDAKNYYLSLSVATLRKLSD